MMYVLKPMYGEKVKLAFAGTYSFVIHIDTYDLHEDRKQIEAYMDFSDYPTGHPNYDNKQKSSW